MRRRAPASPAPTGGIALAVRALVTLAGGYAATIGAVAFLSALATLLGMARSEAVLLMSMLGFPAYLAVILWGFAARRIWRFAAILAAAALLGHWGAVAIVSAGAST